MGNNKSIPESVLSIIDGIRTYLGLKLEYLRVTGLERLINVLSSLLIGLLTVAIAFFIMLFLSLAFVWWYGEHIDNMPLAYVLVAGIWLILGLVIYLLRRPLIINPLVRKWFSEIAFMEQEEGSENIQSDNNEAA